jgi:hypothetical protein
MHTDRTAVLTGRHHCLKWSVPPAASQELGSANSHGRTVRRKTQASSSMMRMSQAPANASSSPCPAPQGGCRRPELLAGGRAPHVSIKHREPRAGNARSRPASRHEPSLLPGPASSAAASPIAGPCAAVGSCRALKEGSPSPAAAALLIQANPPIRQMMSRAMKAMEPAGLQPPRSSSSAPSPPPSISRRHCCSISSSLRSSAPAGITTRATTSPVTGSARRTVRWSELSTWREATRGPAGGARGGGSRKAPRKGCPHTSQPLSCFSSIHRWMQPRCAHCRQAAVGMWEAGAAGRSLIPYGGQLRRGRELAAQGIKRLHADSCTCMLPLQLQIPLSRVSSPSS